MNKYQLNPIYEWIGHAGSALIGGIYGYSKNNELVEKELANQLKIELQNPIVRKNLVTQAINAEKEEIKSNLADIVWCKKEYKRIMSDPNADALEKEDAESYKDIKELLDNISYCKEAIQDLKDMYQSNDIEGLSWRLATTYWRLNEILKKRRKIEGEHSMRSDVLSLGGAALGGIGYHYAKKGLKKLGSKIIKSIDAKRFLKK